MIPNTTEVVQQNAKGALSAIVYLQQVKLLLFIDQAHIQKLCSIFFLSLKEYILAKKLLSFDTPYFGMGTMYKL